MPKKKTAEKNTEKKTLVLLDAHAILHRAFHALPDFASPSGEPTGALYGVVAMLLKIIEELKPDYIAACYDLPEPTYRHEAFKEYKAGRAKTDETLVQQIIRSRDIFAVFGIPIYEHISFEADDMLGTIASQMQTEKDLTVIIASGDMDTMQCIDKKRVQVYTLKKGIKDTIMYDQKAVEERFGFSPKSIPDYKGLRGDPSDNIPGIKGIGEKTATTLIVAFGTIEKMYKVLEKDEAQFTKLGISPRIIELLKNNKEEAEFSKMIATIRTDAPITYVLPQTDWKEAVDTEALLSLFTELGFRTLKSRVQYLFNVPEEKKVQEQDSGVDKETITQASVMLWLLESDRTNASYDDIIDYGRSYYQTTNFDGIVETFTAELKKQNLWDLYTTIELPLSRVIAYMNAMGITLDVAYLQSLSVVMHKELTELEEKIYAQAGTAFNINSPKQMGEVLYDTLGLKPKHQKKTATGQRSTREEELQKMVDDHEIIPALLRYRELQKMVSTYVDNLPPMVSEDGRLRTTFLQTGAVTGRMASQNPGLQNIPVRTEESKAIRRAFVAQKGFEMVAIDYSQIELRIAAILSGDQKLIEIFKNGEDVHSGVASRVFGVPQKEVTREMRRKAKVINFGILYGMGVNALRGNLGEGTSREEAQEFLNAYFNTFTRLAEYLEETKAYARTHGYTETLFGRKRHFPGIASTAPFIRASAERMAINAPVQGTAADLMRIAMIDVFNYIESNQLHDEIHMLLQVHDELVFEIQEDVHDSHIKNLVAIMEGVMHNKESFGVPIAVGVSVGKNWGELVSIQE
jgi:DNA polymerase I